MDETDCKEMIFTGSFNGLQNRLAGLDYFEILRTGRKILKQAKKDRVEATMRMSAVQELTGLTEQDFDFFSSLRLIQVVESGDDPLLSVKDLCGLVRIFSRFVHEGLIS